MNIIIITYVDHETWYFIFISPCGWLKCVSNAYMKFFSGGLISLTLTLLGDHFICWNILFEVYLEIIGHETWDGQC